MDRQIIVVSQEKSLGNLLAQMPSKDIVFRVVDKYGMSLPRRLL